jgi:hypothetical protein
MMPYKQWSDSILDASKYIASREYQEGSWFPGGKAWSSPDELYQILMEDHRADLFFETYRKAFSSDQIQCWHEFRSKLENYYDKMPKHPDPRRVLDDPEWDLVRQAAERFVQAFADRAAQP